MELELIHYIGIYCAICCTILVGKYFDIINRIKDLEDHKRTTKDLVTEYKDYNGEEYTKDLIIKTQQNKIDLLKRKNEMLESINHDLDKKLISYSITKETNKKDSVNTTL